MSDIGDLASSSKQRFVSDMKVVVSDAEEILRATAGVAGEKMGDLRERIGERQIIRKIGANVAGIKLRIRCPFACFRRLQFLPKITRDHFAR